MGNLTMCEHTVSIGEKYWEVKTNTNLSDKTQVAIGTICNKCFPLYLDKYMSCGKEQPVPVRDLVKQTTHKTYA